MMQILKYILGISFVLLLVVSCKNEAKADIKTVEIETATAKKELDPNATYAKAEFTVDGMTCAVGCAATIEKKIAKMEGVKFAKVDFDKKLAMVEYDEAKVTPTSLESTVTSVANLYKVSDMKTVEKFSAEKACAADCKKACCAKDEGKKIACKPDCKKDCCAKKA